jgi:small conductance mechanosensitive channel
VSFAEGENKKTSQFIEPLKPIPSVYIFTSTMDTKIILDKLFNFTVSYGPQFVLALVFLFGGLWAIRKFSGFFRTFLEQRKVDDSLRPFFSTMVEVGMKVALMLVVAGQLGFETTSFIAVVSALAFAIGLALQGSLGNFASGVLVLLFRPFKVGDIIKVDDLIGRVTEIQIFSTILTTPEERKIIIPNGKITENAIECVAAEAPIRCDAVFHLKEETSISLVRATCDEVMRRFPNTLTERGSTVLVTGYPMEAVRLTIGFWTTGKHYHDVLHGMYEEIKHAFDKVGIELSMEDRPED